MTTPALPSDKQLGAIISRFPIAERDEDGHLIPFKPAQMLEGARAWHAAEKLQSVGVELEFHKADFIAALAEQATDTRKFNALLTKYGMTVQVNERAAMTVWWRFLPLDKRNEAMTYARENKISSMNTLRRHLEKPAPVTIDVSTRVVPDRVDAFEPEPAPVASSFSKTVMEGRKLPAGIHVPDIERALQAMDGTRNPWRCAAALFAFIAANPGLLAKTVENLDEGGETLAKMLAKVAK